jgi:hypothetical protein
MTNAAPRVIRLNPMDNIGVALADLEPASALPGGAAALEQIKRGHKVALAAIAPGAPVYRYGQMIGVASGEKTKSEELGFGGVEFVPRQIGAVM